METNDDPDDMKITSPLKNQDLSFLHSNVAVLLSEYGWYLMLACVGLYLIIQHLSKRFQQQQRTSTELEDPGPALRRQEAMEAARKRMQDELDAKAALFLEKQREVEEDKRKQKIEKWESMTEGKSFKGNSSRPQSSDGAASSSSSLKPKSDKKPLRSSGYNPLSGEGGSCSWRPGRRGPSAGG